MKKRICALVLALVMVLALLPMTSLAAEEVPNTTYTYMEAKFGAETAGQWKWLLDTYGARHANVHRWYCETGDDRYADEFYNDCGSDFILAFLRSGGFEETRQEHYEKYLERLQTGDKSLYLYLTTGDADAGLRYQPTALWQVNIKRLDSKYSPQAGFHDGLARVGVLVDGHWKDGFIDAKGQLVVPGGAYDGVFDFSDGAALVRKDGKCGYIDAKGKVIVPLEYDSVYGSRFSLNGVVAVRKDNKYGLVNKSGQVILPLEYDGIEYFSEGLAPIEKDERYGFVNTAGKVVIPPEYDEVRDFSEGLAAVKKDGEWAFIDTAGNIVIPFGKYRNVGEFSEGLAAAYSSDDGSGGYIDKTGRFVISLGEYWSPSAFKNGLAKAYYSVWYGEGDDEYFEAVIDKTGKILTPKDCGSAVVAGSSIIVDGDTLYDTRGNVLIAKGSYDSILPTEDGVVRLKKGGKSGIANDKGQVILPAEYDSAYSREGYIVTEKDEKYTLWDQNGSALTSAPLDSISYISEGLAFVREGKSWGIMTLPEVKAPAPNTAYASTQNVNVDGKSVEFQCYALKDESGNMTNYIKLRDLADILNGSPAQFQVGWDGGVAITTQTAYTPNGSEGDTPYSGNRVYQEATAATKVNGKAANLAAFVLNDDDGGGYTYYQLRDLGKTLGFNVGWAADKGIFVETGKPYDPAN